MQIDRSSLITAVLIGLVAVLAPFLYTIVDTGLGHPGRLAVTLIVTGVAVLSADALGSLIVRIARHFYPLRLGLYRLAPQEGWWVLNDVQGKRDRGHAVARLHFKDGAYCYEGWSISDDFMDLQAQWQCRIIGRQSDGTYAYQGQVMQIASNDRGGRAGPTTGEVLGYLRFHDSRALDDVFMDMAAGSDRRYGASGGIGRHNGKRIDVKVLRQINKTASIPTDDRERLALIRLATETYFLHEQAKVHELHYEPAATS
ncbi:MAG: hypothetical protein KDJ41_18955 [Hyphomicrobiaceae bacterium]|nr:hypothetical protein [Hyphomicrobiaceae bacterium]